MFKKSILAIGIVFLMFSVMLGAALLNGTEAEAASNIPANVYRAYNPNTNDFIYTASQAEYNTLLSNGLRGEGRVFYANGSGNDVHRLYNRSTGEHFYTVNINEMTRCIKLGWRYEGIAFTSSGHNDVYRLSNPNNGYHYFTTSINERDYLWQAGWKYEGVAWKCSSVVSN